MDGSIQHISDTLLMDNLIKLEYLNSGLYKNAQEGSVESDIKGTSSAIKSEVKGKTEGVILNSLLSGAIGKVFWPLGVILKVASWFGVKVFDIFKSIINKIKPALKSKKLTESDVDSAGRSIMATASLAYLYDKEKSGLIKIADENKLTSMFEELKGTAQGKKSGKELIVGIITWLIKTVMSGAGFLTEKAKAVVDSVKTNGAGAAATAGAGAAGAANAVGNWVGNTFSKKNEETWYVPYEGNSVQDTVFSWGSRQDPSISEYRDIVLQLPSFKSVVNDINKTKGRSAMIRMPKEYSDRKTIVDKFLDEAKAEIEKVQKEQNENA